MTNMLSVPCTLHGGPQVIFDSFKCDAHNFSPEEFSITHVNWTKYTLPVLMNTECIRYGVQYGYCLRGTPNSPCSILVATRPIDKKELIND